MGRGRCPAASSVAEDGWSRLAAFAGEDEFVEMRNARDKTLAMPALMIPSVQVNMRAGHMPPPEDNGVSYLKVPINVL